MATTDIRETLSRQRQYFRTGATKPIAFRLEQLRRLRDAVKRYEGQICEALWLDLHKPRLEAFMTEIGSVIHEISAVLSRLPLWSLPRPLPSQLSQFPAFSLTWREPQGTVLIISPWNYPFNLAIAPLIGAIAGGNTAVVKTGHAAPNVARVVEEMLREAFPSDYVAVFHGGRDVNTELLEQTWDHIFFTGSTSLGRVVMRAAAKDVTPVTLELGGKSPVVVLEDANLEIAARRIMWGKLLNAGQTCIAPDYLLVDARVHDELLNRMRERVTRMYGENPKDSRDFGRIISEPQLTRLQHLLDGADVYFGGETDAQQRYVAPTLLQNVTWDDPVMQEEIFGPILPALKIDSLDQAIESVRQQPKPLAFYLFTENPANVLRVARETSSGGLTVNDAVLQIANHDLPFGGVGASGMGQYHGKASFETFTHRKSIFYNATWIDAPVRYAPYRDLTLKLIKLVMQ